jgi:hypothetical protein
LKIQDLGAAPAPKASPDDTQHKAKR